MTLFNERGGMCEHTFRLHEIVVALSHVVMRVSTAIFQTPRTKLAGARTTGHSAASESVDVVGVWVWVVILLRLPSTTSSCRWSGGGVNQSDEEGWSLFS